MPAYAYLKHLKACMVDQADKISHFSLTHGGNTRNFVKYDIGPDSIIAEEGILRPKYHDRRRSVIFANKSALKRGARGLLITATIGDFGSILIPLLLGKLQVPSRIQPQDYTPTIRDRILLIGVESDGLKFFQRDTDFTLLIQADAWFQKQGVPLDAITFQESTVDAIAYCQPLGQLWRINRQACTQSEISDVIDDAWQFGGHECHYYISQKGVAYLPFWEFKHVGDLCKANFEAFSSVLKEWVSIADGFPLSNMRRIKYHDKHAVELLGVDRHISDTVITSALELLCQNITLGRMTQQEAYDTYQGILEIFQHTCKSHLLSLDNVEAQIALYQLILEQTDAPIPSRIRLDERRIALPGATFINGKPHFHPGVDTRTRAIIRHITQSLNQDEAIDYLNVFLLRSSKSLDIVGNSREIVYRTNCAPGEISLIEKKLAQHAVDYGRYMLTRAKSFQALSIVYPDFQLVSRQEAIGKSTQRVSHYFLRTRCPGEPLDAIGKNYFEPAHVESETRGLLQADLPDEDRQTVIALAAFLGRAAAMNLIVKKYIKTAKGTATCRFNKGKEIFQFAYCQAQQREVPIAVRICSVRGVMGWPSLETSQQNLDAIYAFYTPIYAKALFDFWLKHRTATSLNDLASAFYDGYEQQLCESHWAYQQRRDEFDQFTPQLSARYHFVEKWQFTLWAMNRHYHDIPTTRERFMDAVGDLAASAAL